MVASRARRAVEAGGASAPDVGGREQGDHLRELGGSRDGAEGAAFEVAHGPTRFAPFFAEVARDDRPLTKAKSEDLANDGLVAGFIGAGVLAACVVAGLLPAIATVLGRLTRGS